MFLFFSVLLVLFESIVCQTNDSFLYKELYKKFKKNSKSNKELNIIENIYKINEQIIKFDYEFRIIGKNETKKWKDKFLTDFLTSKVDQILKQANVTALINDLEAALSTGSSCLICYAIVNLLFNPLIPFSVFGQVLSVVCSNAFFPNSPVEVCEGIVRQFEEPIDYIRVNKHLSNPEVCGILMGVQCYFISGTCFKNPNPPSKNLCWKLDLNKNKCKKRKRRKDNTIYRILHLTDVHVDPQYVPYVPCETPYCCRGNGTSEQSQDAGFWGSYYCDPPVVAVKNLFQTIKWKLIDIIYWTGDVSAHDVWNDTFNRTFRDSRFISNLIKQFSLTQFVFNAIGNHLSIPVNLYSPPNTPNLKPRLSSRFVYKQLVKEWKQWLPSDVLKTFLRGGYYSRRIRPGFRVIVVNTNYCARLNFWSFYQSIDPANQLKWLRDELDLAERKGDRVHIIGHIPPENMDCYQIWLYNYMAIIERYQCIIVGQFFGHTHYDEFRVLRSNSDCNKAIGCEIISPSFTTYASSLELDPAYRVFIANKYGRIKDALTYTYSLALANSDPEAKPKWYREYSFKGDYSVRLNSVGCAKLYDRLNKNDHLFQLFYSHYTRVSYSQQNCNNSCKTELLSELNVCNAFDSIPPTIFNLI